MTESRKLNKKANDLIHESSPYLLQHAYNPVNWRAWNAANLGEAKEIGKPLLVSIGYSACHWCHVMEHESFEDPEVAEFLNNHFYPIKVDREERPDVDQLYMTAVQLISGRGGWPLNCFTLPDGRPFHGGTYFRKDDFLKVLKVIHREFEGNNEKLQEYARNLTQGIQSNDAPPAIASTEKEEINFLSKVDEAVIQWSSSFDLELGGFKGAPKFPMPNNLKFLIRYGFQTKNQGILDFVDKTLTAMACGGIYDQVGGGFCRYSVDALWKAPHFEKMLYDNGQLIELYSLGFKVFKNSLYKDVVEQSVEFIRREMTHIQGAYYSALDADSEGEEGKFYIWTQDEIESVLSTQEFDLAKRFFKWGKVTEWENEQHILHREENLDLESQSFQEIDKVRKKLFNIRKERIHPGLDDKTITSWNALMVSGLIAANETLQSQEIDCVIERSARFIRENLLTPEGELLHIWKDGKAKINGFLEDYAFAIKMCLELFKSTSMAEWLKLAEQLCEFAIKHFYDRERSLFTTSRRDQKELIHNGIEYFDNVIPSGNSTMCLNFVQLYKILGKTDYQDMYEAMIKTIIPGLTRYPAGFSQWMIAILDAFGSSAELVVMGSGVETIKMQFDEEYHPNVMWLSSEKESSIPIFLNRFKEDETLIYVCKDQTCSLPFKSLQEAIDTLKNE